MFSDSDVRSFLTNHLDSDLQSFEVLMGGDWSRAFGLQISDEYLVARFGKHVEDFEKDQAASGLASSVLPIPRVIEIGKAFDGYFCLSERIFGRILETLDSDDMQAVVPSLFRTRDALREANLEGWFEQVGLPRKSRRQQILEVDEETDRIHGWHDKLLSSPTGIDPYN